MASIYTMVLLALLLFCNPVHSLDESAFFVFGDSLFDVGNNNYINTTNDFRANFPPYVESTGRFSNGRLIPDFIAEYAKLPLIPAYFRSKQDGVTKGVNFASAGAGSLAETYHGKVIDLRTQLRYFKNVSEHLKQMLGAKTSNKLLSDAVYMFSISGNDYVSPLMSNSSLFSSYTEEEYVDMVIGNFTTVIEGAYHIYARALNIQQTKSEDCMEKLQALAKMHNEALLKAINKLEKNLQEFKYTYFDYFRFTTDTINHPSKYGFKESKTACCGSGFYRGIPSCGGKRQVKEYQFCQNVGDYLFFDYGHPTEKANRLSAKLLWEGSNYVIGPYNVKSLFQL